jgi:hypothetical protein
VEVNEGLYLGYCQPCQKIILEVDGIGKHITAAINAAVKVLSKHFQAGLIFVLK